MTENPYVKHRRMEREFLKLCGIDPDGAAHKLQGIVHDAARFLRNMHLRGLYPTSAARLLQIESLTKHGEALLELDEQPSLWCRALQQEAAWERSEGDAPDRQIGEVVIVGVRKDAQWFASLARPALAAEAGFDHYGEIEPFKAWLEAQKIPMDQLSDPWVFDLCRNWRRGREIYKTIL